MDVSPRTGPADEPGQASTPAPAAPKRRGMTAVIALVVLLAAVGFLLVKQLGDASLYYYNVDEAVAKQAELGDSRFRVQGTYEGEATEVDAETIRFDIVFGGESITVEHTGTQPALFEPGRPVVLDGRWAPDGSVFLSDRIAVKHSEEYREENPDRVETDAP